MYESCDDEIQMSIGAAYPFATPLLHAVRLHACVLQIQASCLFDMRCTRWLMARLPSQMSEASDVINGRKAS